MGPNTHIDQYAGFYVRSRLDPKQVEPPQEVVHEGDFLWVRTRLRLQGELGAANLIMVDSGCTMVPHLT